MTLSPNELAPYGISRKHWCPHPALATLGNYYRTFAPAEPCSAGAKPLYFRSFKLGSSPAQDEYGEWHVATAFHVPLVIDTQTVAADAVTGFPVSGTKRILADFGWLGGVTTVSLRVFVFSETATDPRSQLASESSHTQDPVYPSQLASESSHTQDPVYPSIPNSFAANVRAGQQVCTFPDGSTHAFSPRWVFPSKLYFSGPLGRYRAVYLLEPMDYGGKYGGRHQVVGFPVPSANGASPRGFGQLEALFADSVSFEPA